MGYFRSCFYYCSLFEEKLIASGYYHLLFMFLSIDVFKFFAKKNGNRVFMLVKTLENSKAKHEKALQDIKIPEMM